MHFHNLLAIIIWKQIEYHQSNKNLIKVPWEHENMTAMNIIHTLFGNASSFSTGGPGKGMHARATMNLLH